MKKILASLALFSFLAVTACNTATEFQPALQNQDYSSLSKSKAKISADWFDSLSPELQSYYAEAKGETGADLFDSIHKIISRNNHITGYSDSKSFMYSTVDNITQAGKTGTLDAYSGVFVPGSGGDGNTYKEIGDANKDGVPNDFINCEHTWPQSFFNKSLPMVADLHHLQSTLSVPNNRRNNFPFGTVEPGSIVYTTSGGSKLGVVDRSGTKRSVAQINKILAQHSEDSPNISDSGLSTVFEPMDSQKGRTARAMLYFYVRYYDQNIRSGAFSKNEFWVSKVPTFVKWDEQVNPVDNIDRQRNETVFKKQGNRNPFIDIPNLASLIGENVLASK